jgi:hypothetical protein
MPALRWAAIQALTKLNLTAFDRPDVNDLHFAATTAAIELIRFSAALRQSTAFEMPLMYAVPGAAGPGITAELPASHRPRYRR